MLLSDKKRKISLSFNHMALSVKDVNVSAEFYTNVLNFGNTLPPEAENVKWISLGDGKNYTYYQFSKMIWTNKAIHLALST
jgi:catechol-2,3-dioxygenase